jgi:ABC-type lipoprotein release transport system permease subunit
VILSKLVWRNLWRNKRRSIITIASVFFAVFFAVLLRSMQFGTYSKMIENVVGTYSGFVQIHKKGYWDEQIIDNAMPDNAPWMGQMADVSRVKSALPRLEGFALAATEQLTKGVLVVGMKPSLEIEFMKLETRLVGGEMLSENDQGIMLGEGVAKYFNLGINDTMVMLSQGYQGVSARGKFPVRGIVKLPSPVLNNSLVMLSLPEAQYFYGAEGLITSVVVHVDDDRFTERVIRSLESKIDTAQFEVMGWQDMLPELVQAIEADSSGGVIMLLILYMIITFGIFGTVLMMTAERKHEFGILLSIGMKRVKLATVLVMESVFMAAVGVFTGLIAVFPLLVYFYHHPIQFGERAQKAMEEYGFEAVMPASLDPQIAYTHALIILGISIALSIYPIIHVMRMKPVDAMHG